MKLMTLLGKGAVVAGVAAAGVSSGNFARETIQQRALAPQAGYAAVQPDGAVSAPAPESATTDSLLHYRFTPGQRTYYHLNADISGAGIESLAGSSGVAMGFQGDMQVYTERVDDLGNGYLDIRFDHVQMQGSFMDEPVSLSHSVAGTEYHYGNEHISSAAGDSTAGIPQFDFFNTPTKATVSPAGQVLKVSGAAGMDQMLSPETLIASVQFPAGDLDAGAQWESDFGMPVPGLGSPVASRAVNTLVGFDLFRGRYCALIRQTMDARQQDGQVNSPASALGEEMNFSMPEFNLQGENQIYFDVERGELVQANLDLQLTMKIGEQFKAAAEMLDLYGKLLNEIEGGKPDDQPQQDLLNLGLKIRGSLSIVD